MHQEDHFGIKAPLKGLLLGFPNIKTQLEPPIIISLIFKKSLCRWNQCTLVFKVSPDLFRKKTTHFSMISLNSLRVVAQSDVSSNNVYTGTPMALYESPACGNDHTTAGLVKAPYGGTRGACSVYWKWWEPLSSAGLPIMLRCHGMDKMLHMRTWGWDCSCLWIREQ